MKKITTRYDRRSTILALIFVASIANASTWDSTMRTLPRPDSIRSYMHHLSARPHHIGSPYDKENAEWIRDKFQQWGFDARIESFDVLFPTPKERKIELLSPKHFVATLREPSVKGDATSSQQDEQLPTYNAYSIDGDVTAPLVYVNYGTPPDYETLDRLGISVKGCIVIARYGGAWRGIKPKVAAEHGAVGCIIYSDPAGDGYTEGDVFPKGPYRPADGVQRGSVMDMPVHPGDPETPGYGSIDGAKRLAHDEIDVLTKIPVLPISYADAQPMMEVLDGLVAPRDWRGTLPITYHIGTGSATVHLKAQFKWDHVTIRDVIATLRGATVPDEWVIRGNHYDAWVNGAEDPISGLSALLEEARSMGELVKRGWNPQRTMMYCAWDGEEEGLLGSTEWVETHAQELTRSAVAYINSDVSDRGFFGASGSHILETFISDATKDVHDPETNSSIYSRAKLSAIANAGTAEERTTLRSRSSLSIGALGSGSDYTAFLDHLGVPSLDIGFGGEGGGGVYHSIYDDFYWYTHFSDTTFAYGRALAQVAGTAMLRLSDAVVLPFSFADQSRVIKTYIDELQALAKSQREEIVERNTQIDEGVFVATTDPWSPTKAPVSQPVPPFLNFAPLLNAFDSNSHASARYMTVAAASRLATIQQAQPANTVLMQTERSLISAEGLPSRPWFKHQLYAPGLYTGYGVKTIPAVREAIEQKNYPLAEEMIGRVANVLMNEAALISSAAIMLEHANGRQ